MRLLRTLTDMIAGRATDPAHFVPFEEVPGMSERERLMRHTGRPECPIPEHADALRRLGQVTIERDEWMQRALLAEARLHHPSNGRQAA